MLAPPRPFLAVFRGGGGVYPPSLPRTILPGVAGAAPGRPGQGHTMRPALAMRARQRALDDAGPLVQAARGSLDRVVVPAVVALDGQRRHAPGVNLDGEHGPSQGRQRAVPTARDGPGRGWAPAGR